MHGLLSRSILPIEIEIEFTSRCNAQCVVCPRDHMPLHGRMSHETLERILSLVAEIRREYRHEILDAVPALPRVTIAGGGEPFLHSDAQTLLARISEITRNFHIITNGSALTRKRVDALMQIKPASITCSFWGIKEDEYEAAMHLPHHSTLERVIYLAKVAREAGVPFRVEWVRVPELQTADSDIAAFWRSHGIDSGKIGSKIWNRAGLLNSRYVNELPADSVAPDTNLPIWCSEIAFSVAVNWQGDCLLCCCSYFNGSAVPLGSVYHDNWAILMNRKRKLLLERPIPPSCVNCKLPRKDQVEWLVQPLLPFLKENEKRLFSY